MAHLAFRVIDFAYRLKRWVRNPVTGPAARMGRAVDTFAETARGRTGFRHLPHDLMAALLSPMRIPGAPRAVRPPRSYDADRASARLRLAGLAKRLQEPGRPALTIARIADRDVEPDADVRWNVLAVRPEDWRAMLADVDPDALLVEAAWRGNAGAWQYRVAWYAHPDGLLLRDLRALVEWCASRDVATIFWDRSAGEFARFRDAAALFDVVLASDQEAAAKYDGLLDRRGAAVLILPSGSTPGAIFRVVGEAASRMNVRDASVA